MDHLQLSNNTIEARGPFFLQKINTIRFSIIRIRIRINYEENKIKIHYFHELSKD